MPAPTIISASIEANGLWLRLVWSEMVVLDISSPIPAVYADAAALIGANNNTLVPANPITRHALNVQVQYGQVITADVYENTVFSAIDSTGNVGVTGSVSLVGGVAVTNNVSRPPSRRRRTAVI